jgi:hypothetical protein
MLFCGKCNSEMFNKRAEPILFLLVISLNENAEVEIM